MRDAERGSYGDRTSSSLDVGDEFGSTTIYLDASDGHVLAIDLPPGRSIGHTIDTRIARCIRRARGTRAAMRDLRDRYRPGASTIMGLVVWWKKRRGRARSSGGATGARRARPADTE